MGETRQGERDVRDAGLSLKGQKDSGRERQERKRPQTFTQLPTCLQDHINVHSLNDNPRNMKGNWKYVQLQTLLSCARTKQMHLANV